jgi:hypothetical protein
MKIGATLETVGEEVFRNMADVWPQEVELSSCRPVPWDDETSIGSGLSKRNRMKRGLAIAVVAVDCAKGEFALVNGQNIRKGLVIVANRALVQKHRFLSR